MDCFNPLPDRARRATMTSVGSSCGVRGLLGLSPTRGRRKPGLALDGGAPPSRGCWKVTEGIHLQEQVQDLGVTAQWGTGGPHLRAPF